MNVKNIIRSFGIFSVLTTYSFLSLAQTMPQVMDTATLEEQVNYLEDRTNIYNGYRAVRDDIFLKMNKNSLDSLNAAKGRISDLNTNLEQSSVEIDRLNKELNSTRNELQTAIKNRDSLEFFGIPMAKGFYNMIVWGIILGLIAVLVIGWLIFKRNMVVTQQTKKDLEETRKEFEEFRNSAREKSEQLVIKHFNELKKLKEGR